MRWTVALLVALTAVGCASSPDSRTDEELVRDLVTIREFDGHTGFGSLDGRRSYGWEAQRVLVERGRTSVPALTESLHDPSLDSTQRDLVRDTLGRMGPAAREAVPALVGDIEGADASTTVRILWALSRIGPAASGAVPSLISLLEERGDEVLREPIPVGDAVLPASRLREHVAWTLANMEWGADRALPLLAEGAIQTDDANYRIVCRRAMRRILDPEGRPSFPDL